MSKRVRRPPVRFLIGLLFFVLTISAFQTNRGPAGPLVAAAQQQADDDDQERQLFAKEFLQARSTATKRNPPPPRSTSGRIRPTADTAPSMLGITLWRLRPADKNDETQARLLEQESDSEVVLIGERVGADTT